MNADIDYNNLNVMTKIMVVLGKYGKDDINEGCNSNFIHGKRGVMHRLWGEGMWRRTQTK